MFIINELNIDKLIDNDEIVYLGQGFPTHIWPNIFMINLRNVKI